MSDPFAFVMDAARAAFDEPVMIDGMALRGVFDQAATVVQMGGFGAIDAVRPTLTVAAVPGIVAGQSVTIRGAIYRIGRVEPLPGDEIRLILDAPGG